MAETEKWIHVTTSEYIFFIHPNRVWGDHSFPLIDEPQKLLPVKKADEEKTLIVIDNVLENDPNWNALRAAARQLLVATRHNGFIGIPFMLHVEIFEHEFFGSGEINE
jgi:hypothetical protein